MQKCTCWIDCYYYNDPLRCLINSDKVAYLWQVWTSINFKKLTECWEAYFSTSAWWAGDRTWHPPFFPLGHGVCTFSNTSLHRSVLDVSTSDDSRGRSGHECIVVGFTTTYPISGYHHWCCEVESRSRWGVQHYVIKFVSDLRQVGGFLRVLRFPSPIKLTATI